MTEQVKATAHEELVRLTEQIRDEIRSERKTFSDKLETVEKMGVDLQREIDRQHREPIFPGVDAGEFDGTPKSFRKTFISKRPQPGQKGHEQISELQTLNDELFYMEKIRQACKLDSMPNTPEDIRETAKWKQYREAVHAITKANDILDDSGSSVWVPTITSQQMTDFLTMEMRVGSLFQEVRMPSPTFYWPFATAAPIAVPVSEANDYSQAFSPTLTPATYQAFGASDPVGRATFTAKKIRAFQFFTREWSEDTIAAAMPWLNQQMPRAVGRGWENAIVNGDTAGTLDAADASECSTWFNGLRYYCISQGSWAGTSADTHGFPHQQIAYTTPGTWADADFQTSLRGQRVKMDKYGVLLSDLAWIVSLDCYYRMMVLPGMQKLSDFGPQATLLSGQVGSFDDIPVILSQFFFRVEGDNATDTLNGKKHGTLTRSSGGNLLVYRPAWLRGRMASMAVEAIRFPMSDQHAVVMWERGDFNTIHPATATTVNYGYDIKPL